MVGSPGGPERLLTPDWRAQGVAADSAVSAGSGDEFPKVFFGAIRELGPPLALGNVNLPAPPPVIPRAQVPGSGVKGTDVCKSTFTRFKELWGAR